MSVSADGRVEWSVQPETTDQQVQVKIKVIDVSRQEVFQMFNLAVGTFL